MNEIAAIKAKIIRRVHVRMNTWYLNLNCRNFWQQDNFRVSEISKASVTWIVFYVSSKADKGSDSISWIDSLKLPLLSMRIPMMKLRVYWTQRIYTVNVKL